MKLLGFKKILLSFLVGFFIFISFSNFSLAATGQPGDITFTNPLSYDTVDGMLAALLTHLQGIVVTISMIFIIIGALLYMTSAGNDSKMTTAKGAIFAAVIGLALAIAAPSFLGEIYDILGASPEGEVALESAPSILEIAMKVLNFLLSIAGVIAIIMLVAAGIAYLTAAGNEGQIETAKKMTKWSIIGIAVALGALVLVQQVADFF